MKRDIRGRYSPGIQIKAIAKAGNVSEKAVKESLTIVRRWNEYKGIPRGHKRKRGRIQRGLDGVADTKALRPGELAEKD